MSSTILRCSLGDVPLSEGILSIPLRGNWIAPLSFGFTRAPAVGERATLVFKREDGSEDLFVGTLLRSDFVAGSQTVSVTLIGGAGKLIADVPPRDHVSGSTSLPAGLIARSIVDDAGEVLAAGVELALDALTIPRWTRIASSASDALDLLVDRLGLGWRVLADGTIWVGEEVWPAQIGAAFYTAGNPADGTVVYAPNGAPLKVGSTIDGMRASRIQYSIGSGIRATVRKELAGSPDRVAKLTPYRASYAATVKTQHADGFSGLFGGTLDLTCDDPSVGDLLNVRFRTGIPGAIMQIPDGSRVRIAFEGADPRGLYAAAIDQFGDTTLDVVLQALSLVGDNVEIGYLTATCPSGPVSFTLLPISTDPATEVHLAGAVTGPGHKYVKGIKGP